MKLVLIFLLFGLLVLNIQNCDTTEPPKDDDNFLTWEIDTISYPGSFQTLMQTIWGDSINDLWIAGHNNRGYGKAFHFDGKEWKDFLPVWPTGFDTYTFYTSIKLEDVVFLCGSAGYFSNDSLPQYSDSSLILSNKNSQWNISKIGEGGIIFSVSGRKNGKLYASGLDLTLFSFISDQWIKIHFDNDFFLNYETLNINNVLVDRNNNAYLIILYYKSDPALSYNYFLREVNGEWIKIDSFDTRTSSKWGAKFWESDDGNIYSYNPGIYKYNFENWISVFPYSEVITAVNGTTENNIWAAGSRIFHYNGKEWYEYTELSNKYGLASDILLLENHVIILFSNSSNSFIVKGHPK